jgi:hypothetical protein
MSAVQIGKTLGSSLHAIPPYLLVLGKTIRDAQDIVETP